MARESISLLSSLQNYSAGAILKISDSTLCSLCSSISPWIPFRDQATVKKMNEEVATAFIVRKMVVGRQSVRCILTKMFPQSRENDQNVDL